MDIVKETIRASQYVGHKSLVELVEGDVVLSDIKPDILSLVKVCGKAFITEKEALEKKIKLKGMVDIYATYIADDETNSLKSIMATLNFEEYVNMDECESNMMFIVRYDLGSIESRVLNGRKFTVKCPVEIDIKVLKDASFEISTDISDANNIEILKEEIKLNSLVGYNTENISINEKISLSENNFPIGEILQCTIDLINKDYKVSYNKVLAKADAKIRIVYVTDDDNPTIQTFETIIPFTGFIDINGVNDNTTFEIIYNLKSYFIKPIYQDMKANSISVEACIEVLALAYEAKNVVAIQDLYNPEEVLNYNIKNIDIDQSISTLPYVKTLDQVLSIPELENSKLLDVSIKANITNKKLLDDKIVVDGIIVLDIMYYNLTKKTIESKKVELPFQEAVPIDRNSIQNDITLDILDAEYELRPSGQLKINIGLEFKNDSVNKLNINVIDNLEQTNDKVVPVASIVIYPVKAGDTLWNIAKKFRTTIDSIKEVNGLVDDKIYPGYQLIIPKRVYKIELNPLS